MEKLTLKERNWMNERIKHRITTREGAAFSQRCLVGMILAYQTKLRKLKFDNRNLSAEAAILSNKKNGYKDLLDSAKFEVGRLERLHEERMTEGKEEIRCLTIMHDNVIKENTKKEKERSEAVVDFNMLKGEYEVTKTEIKEYAEKLHSKIKELRRDRKQLIQSIHNISQSFRHK